MATVSKRKLEVAEFGFEKTIDLKDQLNEFYEGDDGQRHDKQRLGLRATANEFNVDPSAFRKFRYGSKRLCLFNIIVALEWSPGEAFLTSLQDAFSQASRLLMDVTDGYMAIGKVVVGGPALMSSADIQIFASNRLFPRASVNG